MLLCSELTKFTITIVVTTWDSNAFPLHHQRIPFKMSVIVLLLLVALVFSVRYSLLCKVASVMKGY